MMDRFRALAETCDNLQTIQVTHGISGGTGSGMASAFLSRLSEDWRHKTVSTVTVIPSQGFSDVMTEPYNAVNAMNSLTEFVTSTFVFDNHAISGFCKRQLGNRSPSYNDVSKVIARAMSLVTSSSRFPGGEHNSDLRKQMTNLIPFPRMHYFTP